MVDCSIVDEEWMKLWESDHQISRSNSFYSIPPIDEDYEWSMYSVPQSLTKLNRGGSTLTLSPIGEEISVHVCLYSSDLAFVVIFNGVCTCMYTSTL